MKYYTFKSFQTETTQLHLLHRKKLSDKKTMFKMRENIFFFKRKQK